MQRELLILTVSLYGVCTMHKLRPIVDTKDVMA